MNWVCGGNDGVGEFLWLMLRDCGGVVFVGI